MIRLADLKTQYLSVKPEIDQAILRALENSQFILGPEVAAFEEEFAAWSGARYGIGVNSGTSALHLALLAAEVGPGDEVITSPFTFVASVAAIRYTGATPVFVDIDPRTFNIDPGGIERAMTPKTKAILPIHLFGQCADMDPILEIAGRRGLRVIEDAAQAHGGEYKGRRAGGMGHVACFSFYPGKNLGAFGEGGMVVTNDPECARKVRLMRNWGESTRYHHDLIGFNYRMEGIQGAILRIKLRRLDEWTETRRRNAALMTSLLRGSDVITPSEEPWARHVYSCYVIRVADRRAVIESLTASNVESAIHYPVPLHLQHVHLDLGYRPGDFPVAERAAREALTIPVHAQLSCADVETIARAVLSRMASASVAR